MNEAVGPLSTSPPTIGLTATTGAGRRAAPRRCRARRDRGDRGERVAGSDHDRPGVGDRRQRLLARPRLLGAAELEPLDQPGGALADHELLEGEPAGTGPYPRAHRVIAHRQHSRAHADRLVQARQGGGRRESFGEHARALQAPREVAIAEVEPHIHAELPQGVHHGERVALKAPAALVDAIGQPEGNEIRIGRDVRAVDLDVIARVHDRRDALGLDDVGHPPQRAWLRPCRRRGRRIFIIYD